MLKRKALNRIFITTLVFFIVIVLYSVKRIDNDKISIYKTNSYKTEYSRNLYTLNDDNYISKTSIYVNKELNTLETVKEVIESMIEENNKNALLPSYFNPILPQNTKIISVLLDDKIIKINFSKEFLNVEEGQEEKLIEAIVYTLTEINDVNGVEIYVENEVLKFIPNSTKNLPTILTRDIGINKVYDINGNKNINKVILYFLGNGEEYIPITKYVNDEREKIEIIVESLSNKYLFLNNLISAFSANLKLLNYKILDNSIILNFNNYLLDDNNNINEEYADVISYCVFNNYDVSNVIFYVNDKKIMEKTKKILNK